MKKSPTFLARHVLICKCLFVILLLSFGLNEQTKAQKFYQPIVFDPSGSYPFTGLGWMFNPQTYSLTGIPTLYYGNQNLYATAYLPYLSTEYDPAKPLELFGPNYTTGLALASPRDPALGLYAQVQVAASDAANNLSAFASIIPHDQNELNFKGPFDQLKYLNDPVSPNFTSPVPGIVGITALEGTQKFTKFSHDLLNWDGLDKAGAKVINVEIKPWVDAIGSVSAEYIEGQNKLIFYKTPENDQNVGRSMIGHEMGHGMISSIPGYSVAAESIYRRELDEGFCDIIANAYANWLSPQQFENPDWHEVPEYAVAIPNLIFYTFDKPKLFNHPNTFLGVNYKTPGDVGYEIHNNGSILKYWFYLLNHLGKGTVDDNPAKPFFQIPLIPDNKTENYKLALKLTFKTFTEKLSAISTYLDVYEQSFKTLNDLGYQVNSRADLSLRNAWYAVGIGNKPDLYEPVCGKTRSAETWYNGTVTVPVTGFFTDNDPIGPLPESYVLVDCASDTKISTLEYFEPMNGTVPMWDTEPDGIFSYLNNGNLSKSAVGIHTFSTTSAKWFKDKLNHIGLDNAGTNQVVNIIGKTGIGEAQFNLIDHVYEYPIEGAYSEIDAVTQTYFLGINNYLKQDPNVTQDYAHPEWEALRNGLAQIFAVNIKNEYKKALDPQYQPVWTLYEDMANSPNQFSFATPKLKLKPALYKGDYWSDIYPATNSSIIDLWYYLLEQGTDDPQGYTNERGNTYFIISSHTPEHKQFLLNLIWNAYKATPTFGDIQDFRLATHKVLSDMGFGEKSKEYIALYDAWAAILNIPDYASSLKHEPQAGETIDPWPAKIGVEVEYPHYESKRIFEVSENPKFNDQLATVYRFLNYVAPDFATGMTYGKVNLEPEKTYYVRSHLYKSGAELRVGGGCEASPDPAFCQSLQGKEKWTLPFSFKTGKKEVVDLSPENTTAPAWTTPFSWTATPGAHGYLMKIGEEGGAIKEVEFNSIYDPDISNIEQKLALSKQKKYNWTLVPRARLGSNQGVKITLSPIPNLLNYESLTPAEIEAFPFAYGTTSRTLSFKTDLPKVKLGLPADGTHVPMLGSLTTKASLDEPRADYYRWDFFYNGDFMDPSHSEDHEQAEVTINFLENLLFLSDQHVYGWTFTPVKKATNPFINTDETGETAPPLHFIIDKQLIPKPELHDFKCANNGQDLIFSWDEVKGAKGYRYQIKNLVNNQIIANDIISQTQTPTINNASTYPGSYTWSVSAGVKDVNGNWVFGPESTSTYDSGPSGIDHDSLSPHNQTVGLGNNQSITFHWDPVAGVGAYKFSLIKTGGDFVVDGMVLNGTAVTINNLEYETDYSWTVSTVGDTPCQTATGAFFKTEPMPFIPSLGINLWTADGSGAPLHSFKYRILVTRPDGGTDIDIIQYSGGIGLLYIPLGNQQLWYSGELTPQDGWYNIHLEISEVLQKDPKLTDGLPTWELEVNSFNVAPAINQNGQPILVSSVIGNGAFGALSPGMSVDIPFYYNLKELNK